MSLNWIAQQKEDQDNCYLCDHPIKFLRYYEAPKVVACDRCGQELEPTNELLAKVLFSIKDSLGVFSNSCTR